MSIASKLDRVVTYLEQISPIKLIDPLNPFSLSRGLARSRDKLKAFYFHYRSAYSHQAWQDDDLP